MVIPVNGDRADLASDVKDVEDEPTPEDPVADKLELNNKLTSFESEDTAALVAASKAPPDFATALIKARSSLLTESLSSKVESNIVVADITSHLKEDKDFNKKKQKMAEHENKVLKTLCFQTPETKIS